MLELLFWTVSSTDSANGDISDTCAHHSPPFFLPQTLKCIHHFLLRGVFRRIRRQYGLIRKSSINPFGDGELLSRLESFRIPVLIHRTIAEDEKALANLLNIALRKAGLSREVREVFVIRMFSSSIGTVCFPVCTHADRYGKNVRQQLDFVATDQVVLLNGVGNLTLLLQIVGGLGTDVTDLA